MSILVINAGSSSLKFGLFDPAASTESATGLIDWTADPRQADLVVRSGGSEHRHQLNVSDHRAAVAQALRVLVERELIGPSAGPAVMAVGHRVVHGGTVFRESVRIDPAVKAKIAGLAELAPLHNPPALEGIDAGETALPGVPQVAVFDTAFFAGMPPSAYVYPLPYEWYTDWGIRRFGFHGISHAYCTGRAGEMLGRGPRGLRLVCCHLGNGCSAAAVRDGAALATTMGFTPMEGLMMGSRAGSVDPGIMVHVLRQRGLSPDRLDEALNRASGLLGVSGVSSDFRQVEAAAGQGNERARLALDIYARRVRAAVGALAVTLGGVDALVFTAGVGENSISLRAAACTGLECLGLRLDPQRNAACRPDGDIAAPASPARILVIHTREDLMIAREVRRLLAGSSPSAMPS
jgi:acetate kinase